VSVYKKSNCFVARSIFTIDVTDPNRVKTIKTRNELAITIESVDSIEKFHQKIIKIDSKPIYI